MKKIVYFTFMLIIISFFIGCKSYEEKMAEFAKEAEEFKSTLPPNTDVLCVISDSIATKVFYREEDSSTINVYDLETDSKSKIVLEDEMYYYGHKARRYNDRLFVIVETGACGSGLGNQQCVFYINVRDNSSHLVTCCEEATFLDNCEIYIKRAFPVDDSGPSYEWEWQRDEYKLSTSLSNEEYSSREKMQEEKEESIAREERNRPKEVEIYIRAIHPVSERTELLETRGCSAHVVPFGSGYEDEVVTDVIEVPYGKMWISKSISWNNAITMITYNSSRYEDMPSNNLTLRGGETFRIKIDPYPLNHTSVFRAVFTEVADY